MTPKGTRQQHPNPKPKNHSTDLSPSSPVLSQGTSRSWILPSHHRATRELEGGRKGRCWGLRTAGTTHTGMSQGRLRASHSSAGNSPGSPLPFLPSGTFPDLGE